MGPRGLPEELASRLATVRSVAAITGAGLSAESGIPTYRGSGGVYDDPTEGEAMVEALSGDVLARDPDRTWRAIAQLARHAAGARPNPGHLALAEIERSAERFAMLTQNVDGLHRLAGVTNVVEIHGHVFDTRCTGCSETGEISRASLAAAERAPRCASCDEPLRPDVVLFGEWLPPRQVDRMRRELYERPADLLLVVGTTALFPYIAEPVVIAREAGSEVVEINPEPTLISELATFTLRGAAGRWLPLVARALGTNGERRTDEERDDGG